MDVIIDCDEWYPVYYIEEDKTADVIAYYKAQGWTTELSEAQVAQVKAAQTAFEDAQQILREAQ